jgi:glycine hydroxymethyltransferase
VDVLSHTKPSIVEKTGQPSKAACTVDPKVLERSQERILDLLRNFPLYPEIDLNHENKAGMTKASISS